MKDIVENVKVYGLEESIKRAKYPMSTNINILDNNLTDGIKKLAQSERGSGHDQWLTGVVVQFDLTFSIKAWTEAERYHFFDFVSSQSTMHRITKFDFDDDNTYMPYVDQRVIDIMQDKVREYNDLKQAEHTWTRDHLSEGEIEKYEERLKKKYLEILYTNPCGFRLTAGMTTNYRQLKTIYAQRRNHRLPEWKAFCEWIETLPMSSLITMSHRDELELESEKTLDLRKDLESLGVEDAIQSVCGKIKSSLSEGVNHVYITVYTNAVEDLFDVLMKDGFVCGVVRTDRGICKIIVCKKYKAGE